MQLHQMGSIREIRLYRCGSAGDGQPLEGSDGQRLSALLIPGKCPARGEIRVFHSASYVGCPLSQPSTYGIWLYHVSIPWRTDLRYSILLAKFKPNR